MNNRIITRELLRFDDGIKIKLQLRGSDIYDEHGKLKKYLTFRGETRKGSRWGTAKTRNVLIHDELKYWLKNYDQPESGYLFPSQSKSGHITRRGVDKKSAIAVSRYGANSIFNPQFPLMGN